MDISQPVWDLNYPYYGKCLAYIISFPIAWFRCPSSFQGIPLWGVCLSPVLHFSLCGIITQHHSLHAHPITLVSNSDTEIPKGTCSHSSHCFHSSKSEKKLREFFSFFYLSVTSLITWVCLTSVPTWSTNENRGNFRLTLSQLKGFLSADFSSCNNFDRLFTEEMNSVNNGNRINNPK